MFARLRFSLPAAPALVLVLVSPALANSIAPAAYMLPGMLPLTLGMALPASVLAAFLERPLIAWAGVREHTLRYSLQANFLSLVLGYAMLPLAMFAFYSFGILWSLIAIVVSITSERWWYRRRLGPARDLVKWGGVVGANLLSSAVLLFVPALTECVLDSSPRAAIEMAPFENRVYWLSVAASLAVFAASFGLPEPSSPSPDDAPLSE